MEIPASHVLVSACHASVLHPTARPADQDSSKLEFVSTHVLHSTSCGQIAEYVCWLVPTEPTAREGSATHALLHVLLAQELPPTAQDVSATFILVVTCVLEPVQLVSFLTILLTEVSVSLAIQNALNAQLQDSVLVVSTQVHDSSTEGVLFVNLTQF